MDEKENATSLICKDWAFKVKIIRPSAGALGFKGRKIKVKNAKDFLLSSLQGTVKDGAWLFFNFSVKLGLLLVHRNCFRTSTPDVSADSND